MILTPAAYWRQSKNWKSLLGKTGTVIYSTNGFALVTINHKRYEIPTVGIIKFAPGDKIICTLRRLPQNSPSGLIGYGIKVKKLD